jgi:adenylate cyclase
VTLPLDAPIREPAVNLLSTHHRQVTVVFIDLRGFTAFSETAKPEDVVEVLREYRAELGRLAAAHAGALERFTRYGGVVFFDDRDSAPTPPERALSMVFDMRDHLDQLISKWRKANYDLDLAVGVAHGYPTVFGTVPNLAADLCEKAKPGQILVSRRVFAAVEHVVEAEPIGDLTLQGFLGPMPVFNVRSRKGDP